MKIIILKDKEKVCSYVSKEIINQIRSRKNSTIGFATGLTMDQIYKKVAYIIKKDNIDINKIKTFNLDEYFNVKYKKSFRKYMDDNLFNKININNEQINFLSYSEGNWKKECERYEKILSKSRIDLQILGLGKNSHIAYNEPGSSINSVTRKVRISEMTRKDKKIESKYALTMGIKDIMKSKKIILVAFGKEKAKAVHNSFRGKISKRFPASFLMKHDNLEIVLDVEAAAFLKRIK